MSHYSAGTYTAGSSVGYLLRRASNLMTPCVEAAFSHHEITFAQWIVLMHLRDGIASTAADIARGMCHDSGALTRVIDHLAQRGFITRHRNLDDRRVVTLALTELGRRMVESLIPLVVDLLNRALEPFTRDEVDTLTRLLAKLIDNIPAPSGPKPTSQTTIRQATTGRPDARLETIHE